MESARSRLMVRWAFAVGLLPIVLLSACVPMSDSSWPSGQTGGSTLAVLDWDTATVTLPIDAYGMDAREMRTVRAAGVVVFARCATSQVDRAVLDEAIRTLNEPVVPDPVVNHWLFGVWDAEFIVKHGWRSFAYSESGEWSIYTQVDQETDERCWYDPEHQSMMTIRSNRDGVSAPLQLVAISAYDKTRADPRYVGLRTRLGECVAEAGYAVLDLVDGGGVRVEEDWTDGQLLEAYLTEARCDDQMGMTQQVADIAEAYQLELIQGREAEFLAIRQEAVNRVAKAEAILREAGVL